MPPERGWLLGLIHAGLVCSDNIRLYGYPAPIGGSDHACVNWPFSAFNRLNRELSGRNLGN